MSPLSTLFLCCVELVANALVCYDCNSEYDRRCGDPFDPYSIGLVNCSKQDPPEHLKDRNKPILCRKTTQRGKLFKRSPTLALLIDC